MVTFRRVLLMPLVVTVCALLLVTTPGVAQAAQSHGISGATWSDSGVWYISTTYRLKEGSGYVLLFFDSLPRLANGSTDGIKWMFIGNAGENLGGPYVMRSTNTTYTTAYIGNAAMFRNSFARLTTCMSNGCRHDFAGLERY
jgi:hypothetical protein